MFMRYMYIYINTYIFEKYTPKSFYYWTFITENLLQTCVKAPSIECFLEINKNKKNICCVYYAIFNICFFMNYFKSMQKSLNKT